MVLTKQLSHLLGLLIFTELGGVSAHVHVEENLEASPCIWYLHRNV